MKRRQDIRDCWMCEGAKVIYNESFPGYTTCNECGGAGKKLYKECWCEACQEWVLSAIVDDDIVCMLCMEKFK